MQHSWPSGETALSSWRGWAMQGAWPQLVLATPLSRTELHDGRPQWASAMGVCYGRLLWPPQRAAGQAGRKAPTPQELSGTPVQRNSTYRQASRLRPAAAAAIKCAHETIMSWLKGLGRRLSGKLLSCFIILRGYAMLLSVVAALAYTYTYKHTYICIYIYTYINI